MYEMRNSLHWRIAVAAIVALGGFHALGWNPGPRRALAFQPSAGFCQITDADDLLERLGQRTLATGVRLVVNEQQVEPGEVVKARLLNFTRDVVRSYSEFKIQWHGKEGWKTSPSSPDGPWPRRLGKLPPGDAGRCYRFSVPAEQGPGRYRFLTRVDSGSVTKRKAAEFFVRVAE
jgi:hypothetical protein